MGKLALLKLWTFYTNPTVLIELFLQVDNAVCDCKVVGSAGDGCGFFPSEGSNINPVNKMSAIKQDIDMNIFLNTIQLREENVWSIPGALGFARIVFSTTEVCYTLNSLFW